MCDRAYQLSGHDREIMLDSLKLKGMCLFRLGSLIESVKVLYKARMLQRKINAEIEARRRARMKKEIEDEIVGYFTKRDLMNVRRAIRGRSRSFYFNNPERLPKLKAG